jgi:hypothetical protein
MGPLCFDGSHRVLIVKPQESLAPILALDKKAPTREKLLFF